MKKHDETAGYWKNMNLDEIKKHLASLAGKTIKLVTLGDESYDIVFEDDSWISFYPDCGSAGASIGTDWSKRK